MGIRLLISDIDGTLVHKDIRVDGSTIACGNTRAVATGTVARLQALQASHIPVVLVTGRRTKNYRILANIIPHGLAILEHGGIILHADGSRDVEWHSLLAPWVGSPPSRSGTLWDFEAVLRAEGFLTDSEERDTSFRIHPPPSGSVPDNDAYQALRQRELPVGLTMLWTYGATLECFPTASGKRNAVNFMLKRLGVNIQDVAMIGDDSNDMDLLTAVGYPCTLASAIAEVVTLVQGRGGFVARSGGHEGIQEILTYLAS